MPNSSDPNPGERQARRLENVYQQLDALLRQPEVARRLRAAPGENDWSALQVIGHMTEMIPYWLAHVRTVMDAAEPPRFGRTLDAPERLAAVDPSALRDPDELMRLLGNEIQTAASAMRQLTPAERAKKGIHNRLGEITVADMLEQLVVAHAEDHFRQVQSALQTSAD